MNIADEDDLVWNTAQTLLEMCKQPSAVTLKSVRRWVTLKHLFRKEILPLKLLYSITFPVLYSVVRFDISVI
jgi:hypothetical protein